jgi:hypothetical protein
MSFECLCCYKASLPAFTSNGSQIFLPSWYPHWLHQHLYKVYTRFCILVEGCYFIMMHPSSSRFKDKKTANVYRDFSSIFSIASKSDVPTSFMFNSRRKLVTALHWFRSRFSPLISISNQLGAFKTLAKYSG